MAGPFAEAVQVYQQIVALKAQYETLVELNPWTVEGGPGVGQTLYQLHMQADAGREWLMLNGYGIAAQILAADTSDQAEAWYQQNPDLSVPGAGGGGGGGVVTLPGLPALRAAWGANADWLNAGAPGLWWQLQGVVTGFGGA